MRAVPWQRGGRLALTDRQIGALFTGINVTWVMNSDNSRAYSYSPPKWLTTLLVAVNYLVPYGTLGRKWVSGTDLPSGAEVMTHSGGLTSLNARPSNSVTCSLGSK